MSTCYHCGQDNPKNTINFDEKSFCCVGCKSVYEILNTEVLKSYYEFNMNPGIRPDDKNLEQFNSLDTEEIFNSLIDFSEKNLTLVTFKIPVIHCSSCVWVLESLNKIHANITNSSVNFTKKTVQITFKHQELPLSELAKFLTRLGYKPIISSEPIENQKNKTNSNLIIKLAIAGFAFGNVMLFALPEYLEKEDFWMQKYETFFRYLMFLFSIPVATYCSSDYYKSALAGIRNKIINIDIPISIGILVLFFRSCYEAYFDISSGYFDSLCGLLFFMLIGKYFQQRTYQSLSFDRDYKSFYPISVTKIDFENGRKNILLSKVKVNDRILIRNEEIIPADVILIKGNARINNSFITGETELIGSMIECEVIKEVNQSYLTELWNHTAFKKDRSLIENLTTKVSKYFTIFILTLTLFSAIFWYFIDVSKMFQVITAILIVACPCALALSAPFTMGNMMRILGRLKLYVKEANTIEKLAQATHLVFDKTGTISVANSKNITYEGIELSENEKNNIASLIENSNHPLSRNLYQFLNSNHFQEVVDFEEISGKGLQGKIQGRNYKIGSSSFINQQKSVEGKTEVYVQIDGETKGKFVFKSQYREELEQVISKLKNYKFSLVSGDNSNEEEHLKTIFPEHTHFLFNQSPENKLKYIESLQKNKENVLMIGDGLNDAGALKQSNIGIAISDDINSFTPSSDAILDGKKFKYLANYLQLSRKSIQIVWGSFLISFFYNVIGLSFAVSGNLSPLVAAILMPISSISVVSFTSLATWLSAKKINKASF